VCFTLYAASTATVDIHTACPTSLTGTATLRFSSQHTLLCTTLHYYRGGARGNGIGGIGSTRKGVQLDIDRIFAGEICVLAGGAKFTADSVLCGVLKVTCRNVLLPTLAEYECCYCYSCYLCCFEEHRRHTELQLLYAQSLSFAHASWAAACAIA
jgi:hypothetical protein